MINKKNCLEMNPVPIEKNYNIDYRINRLVGEYFSNSF